MFSQLNPLPYPPYFFSLLTPSFSSHPSHPSPMPCRSLLGLLTASIMEVASNFQNVAFQLVRSIVDAKIIVPEVSTHVCMYVCHASPALSHYLFLHSLPVLLISSLPFPLLYDLSVLNTSPSPSPSFDTIRLHLTLHSHSLFSSLFSVIKSLNIVNLFFLNAGV